MIYYITSPTYKEVISSVIAENDRLLLAGCEEGEDILLYSHIKANSATVFSTIDCIVIDLSACCDVDEKIIEAIEMLKMTNDEIQIVILATRRHPGDLLLTQCFQMAIYDIICSDDFLKIRQELQQCLSKGKQYKDALEFKNSSKDQVVVKTAIKKMVNKVMIAFAGTQAHIGTTHNAIVLANFLRKKGYMVALVECNFHDSFKQIAENMDIRVNEDGEFTFNGIDFYPSVDTAKLATILGKSYNFIISDFGTFHNCDQVTYNKSEVRIIVAGAKAWEIEHVNQVFGAVAAQETLQGYHYCFNFVPEIHQAAVKDGMAELGGTHFLKYTENPYVAYDFTDAEQILVDYMPDKPEETKKSLFSFVKGKK